MTSGPPPPPFPPAGSPPLVPEGWRAEWSNEYKTWYYFNPSTQASTWQNPLNNASAPLSPPPYASNPNMPQPGNRDIYDDDEKSSSSTARGFPPVLNRIFGSHHSTPAPPPPPEHTRPSMLPLYIHAATFCDTDITLKIRSMITPQQTLSLHCDSLTFHFGDPWPNHKKQFSMLYSYGQQPWQLIATAEGNETVSLHPMNPVDNHRAAFVQSPNSRVVAMVWGKMNALGEAGGEGRSSGLKMVEVEREGRFEASNRWMGFDGAENMEKMAVVYFRNQDGSVGVMTAREGETGRLPWNAFAGAF